jgi:hypothetical protein
MKSRDFGVHLSCGILIAAFKPVEAILSIYSRCAAQ